MIENNETENTVSDNNTEDLSNDLSDDFGVSFEADVIKRDSLDNIPKKSSMTNMLIKHSGGAIKDEKQASYIFLIIIMISISTSFFMLFDFGSDVNTDIEIRSAEYFIP